MRRWPIAPRPDGAEAPAVPESTVAEVAAALQAGGVLLMPTDTIYGLHAVARDAGPVDRITAMKGRDDTKPFVVIAADAGQVASLGVEIEPRLMKALQSIWPAPLTAVLQLRAPVPASRGLSTLAVRIPALPWLRQVMSLTGPLASTSANRSGEPVITSPADLASDLLGALDGVVDAGPVVGEPSVIVDFTGTEPRFIRGGESLFTQQVRKTLRKSL